MGQRKFSLEFKLEAVRLLGIAALRCLRPAAPHLLSNGADAPIEPPHTATRQPRDPHHAAATNAGADRTRPGHRAFVGRPMSARSIRPHEFCGLRVCLESHAERATRRSRMMTEAA